MNCIGIVLYKCGEMNFGIYGYYLWCRVYRYVINRFDNKCRYLLYSNFWWFKFFDNCSGIVICIL